MEPQRLIDKAARAIRGTKYTRGVKGRRTEDPKPGDLRYAAAALPTLLYELANVTATQGRLSSGALIQLAQEIEKAGT